MFKKEPIQVELLPALLKDAERDELETLRAEKKSRENEALEAERLKALAEYEARKWKEEGNETGVFSLEIDGGKLWRIGKQVFFQGKTSHVTSYVTGSTGYSNCYTTNSYADMKPLGSWS